MEPKHVTNMFDVKMKGVVLGGKANGLSGCPPTMEPPKEIKKKIFKKMRDHS